MLCSLLEKYKSPHLFGTASSTVRKKDFPNTPENRTKGKYGSPYFSKILNSKYILSRSQVECWLMGMLNPPLRGNALL